MPRKEILDGLLEKYKGQPVGDGYIDIIVSRENYHSFAKALIESGFLIEAISWCEYIENIDRPNTYGMGGYRSRFDPGWFAIQETLYLLSVPGIRKSIREGMDTPVDECNEELDR